MGKCARILGYQLQVESCSHKPLAELLIFCPAGPVLDSCLAGGVLCKIEEVRIDISVIFDVVWSLAQQALDDFQRIGGSLGLFLQECCQGCSVSNRHWTGNVGGFTGVTINADLGHCVHIDFPTVTMGRSIIYPGGVQVAGDTRAVTVQYAGNEEGCAVTVT